MVNIFKGIVNSMIETILVVAVAVLMGIGYGVYTGEKDHPIEEAAEQIIEDRLGLPKDSLDLTPGSPEKKKPAPKKPAKPKKV